MVAIGKREPDNFPLEWLKVTVSHRICHSGVAGTEQLAHQGLPSVNSLTVRVSSAMLA